MATKKTESEVAETKATAKGEKAEEEERVTVMIPFIEGEDPEVTVWVNDHITQIKKGRQVKVTKAVATVLENSNLSMMTAYDNQQKLKNQRQDW
jgi:hypothetical protein